MRTLKTMLVALLALSLGAPALAEGEEAKGPDEIMGWLRHRFRVVARRVRKQVGPAEWAKLVAFWKEVARDRIKAGRGRRMRAFVRIARSYARALRKGRLEAWLAKARERWQKKPLIPHK
jgi:hypothetical protein